MRCLVQNQNSFSQFWLFASTSDYLHSIILTHFDEEVVRSQEPGAEPEVLRLRSEWLLCDWRMTHGLKPRPLGAEWKKKHASIFKPYPASGVGYF